MNKKITRMIKPMSITTTQISWAELLDKVDTNSVKMTSYSPSSIESLLTLLMNGIVFQVFAIKKGGEVTLHAGSGVVREMYDFYRGKTRTGLTWNGLLDHKSFNELDAEVKGAILSKELTFTLISCSETEDGIEYMNEIVKSRM